MSTESLNNNDEIKNENDNQRLNQFESSSSNPNNLSVSSSSSESSSKWCSVCCKFYTVSSFSKKQWRAAARLRKCTACIQNIQPSTKSDSNSSSSFSSSSSACNGMCNPYDNHLHSCSSCHLNLTYINFDNESSSSEFHKPDNERRCRLCTQPNINPIDLSNPSLYRICHYCHRNRSIHQHTVIEWNKPVSESVCIECQDWLSFVDTIPSYHH
jgi:hypothetical protein